MGRDYFSADTIAAVATSLAGDAGVGIVRLSGPKALDAARVVCRGLERPEPRFLHRIEILSQEDHGGLREVIDDGLGVYFPQGHSFTGEEVVELQLHGGRFLLQSVLSGLLQTGLCRMALPGEFSFRGVRNGKLSLTGAQALGQLIHARSLFEVRAARRALSKQRFERVEKLANELRSLLAKVELSIDFSDQDVEVISEKDLRAKLGDLCVETETIRGHLVGAQRLADGVRVTLLGRPNAGKSTLFNAILAEDRAIVSSEAGTTRDVITEEVSVGPYLVRLADTAGLRSADGSVEREGVERAEELGRSSELILYVVDAGLSLPEITDEIRKAAARDPKPLIVVNKVDLAAPETVSSVKEITDGMKARMVGVVAASAQGVEQLVAALRAELDDRFGLAAEAFLPTEFQLQMLVQCKATLSQAVDLVEKEGTSRPELVSSLLASSARALSDLVGETTPDSVLAQIFSEFCIGK